MAAMDENTGLRDVTLRSGPATMMYDYDENDVSRSKIERLTLIWSDNLMIAVANAIE
jgi:hypothetical protein